MSVEPSNPVLPQQPVEVIQTPVPVIQSTSWIPCCQRCLKQLDLDPETYTRFIEENSMKIKTLLKSKSFEGSSSDIEIPSSVEELFCLITDITNVQFPLCTTCCSDVLTDIIDSLKEEERSVKSITETIGVLSSDSSNNNTQNVSKKTEEDLLKEKEKIEKEIESIKMNINNLYNELLYTDKDSERIKNAEEDILKEYNNIYSIIEKKHIEKKDVDIQRDILDYNLDTLKKYNVFNNSFFIWFDGPVAVINNFHLGKIPTKNIDWLEVNQALGEVISCVYSLGLFAKFRFNTITLNPLGAYSSVNSKQDNVNYVLNFSVSKNNKKQFLQGLQYFIMGVKEFLEYMSTKHNIGTPYEITETSIGGYEYNMLDLDVWTHAMKLLMIDIKKLYIYTCTQQIYIP
ncbi:hypothetical protein WA158_002416 [Blastocystis sp. Blastoise]